MLSDVIAGVRWNASLGAKFLRVVPYSTLVIVLLTLISQIAMLVASFLPLKVIIMLGSEGIPSYFPNFLAAFGRDALIGMLSVGTVGFFLAHLVCERLIENVTGYAASRLLAKSHKMVLFENQEDLAATSYQRYSRALASGVFVCFSLIGLGWVYPEMPLVMVGYFFFVLLLISQGRKYSAGMQDRLESKLAQLMNVSAMAGFFVAFGYLVIDFVFFTPPGVMVALISFLLIRQTMQRAASMTADLTLLYRQKPKLNALFFHGQVFQPLHFDSAHNLWPLLTTDSREIWVGEVLVDLLGRGSTGVRSSWYQLGNPSVVGLHVTRGEETFLFKLYEPNRISLALHEADLISNPPKHLPSARWVGTMPVGKFQCLVYQLDSGQKPELSKVGDLTNELRGALLAVHPRPEIVERYSRSKAMLWQRLNLEMVERLRVAAISIEERHNIDLMVSQISVLKKLLLSMPLAISNPELNQDTIWLVEEREGLEVKSILLNWGLWTLDPIGAGWPESEFFLGLLGRALEVASVKRSDLNVLTVKQAELAALAFALERECNRQRYNQALELIPRILERMSKLESLDVSRNINAE